MRDVGGCEVIRLFGVDSGVFGAIFRGFGCRIWLMEVVERLCSGIYMQNRTCISDMILYKQIIRI